MKPTYTIILPIIIILLSSCRDSEIKTMQSQLAINKHYFYGDVSKLDTLLLTIRLEDDLTKYFYTSGTDTMGYSFAIPTADSSYIIKFNQKCQLIDSRTYTVSNEEFIVRSYYYDDPESNDEETTSYIEKNNGLLVAFNNGWGVLAYTIEIDEISAELIDSVLCDSSGFYMNVEELLPSFH